MILISGTQVESDACYLHIKIKKANPLKKICPIEKTISQIILTSDIYIFIAGIARLLKS